MATRPTLTALGCRSCQKLIFRAVAPSPASASRSIATHSRTKPWQLAGQRPFSTETKEAGAAPSAALQEGSESVQEAHWFLEEEPPRHPPSLHQAKLPQVPDDAPPMLDAMMKYVYEDMGLDDLSMLDLRDLDPHPSLGPNLIMLFGTARSERHLHVSSGRFVRWLRRNHNLGARAEGLIGPGELKTKLRRLRKKAKLMGQNTAMIPGGDNGISTGWVCVNFRATGDSDKEEANFDESGNFSGFGAPRKGTTIVVQCMTEVRRQELELEDLWKGILKRNLAEQAKIRGEQASESQLEELMASKLQLHEAPGTAQWDAMKRASQQQQRYFSTAARRLQTSSEQSTSAAAGTILRQANLSQALQASKYDLLYRDIVNVQLGGAPMDQGMLQNLVSGVLCAPETAKMPASERLALVDQLLHTGDERGLEVLSKEMLVTLIEALALCPVHGTETQQAQRNFELLLTESRECPAVAQTERLMRAYAFRHDWDRFWYAFRTPTRFSRSREPRLYILAFEKMTSTGDPELCAEALRWLYPEMLTEKVPVLPAGKVFSALKSCILTADPSAEYRIRNQPSSPNTSYYRKKKLRRKEFVKMLREVEALQLHTT